MKYIDADKLKAEIERQKAKYRKDMYKSNYEGLASGYKIEACNELLSILDTLSEEPDSEDLEKAAEISFDEAYVLTEDYRDFLAKGLTENRPHPIGPHWFCEYAKNRFIAGAKWQAEQGKSKEVIVGLSTNKLICEISEDILNQLDVNPGDKVIIQIRKV